jgi:transposase InsO family protein
LSLREEVAVDADEEIIAWFNTRGIHTSVGNRPPLQDEAEYAADAPR